MQLHAINIMGRPYEIRYVRLDPSTHGEVDATAGVIYLNTRTQQTRETLIHEILHAILHESGLTHVLTENVEEAVVSAVESGLIRSGVIRDLG